LHVSCIDKEHRLQNRHWGFYKRRIADYVTGVTEGFALPLRLVGVGYRAQIEPLKMKGKEGVDYQLFERFITIQTHNIRKNIIRSYISNTYPQSSFGQLIQLRNLLSPEINLNFRQFESGGGPMPSIPEKLVLKLGYTHNVELIIPPFIKAQCPNPTTIVLRSSHKRSLSEFASQIRKWRPPEPYKGKGVFVGDEKINIKQKRVK
jgi:large subunit ribosomal protein L6